MFQEICQHAMTVVARAAAGVREKHENRSRMNIELKGRHNFVTEVDKHTEEILVEGLKKTLPEAGFITEEGTAKHRGERFNWVIDPIDGTTNFIHGLTPFAISVALTEDHIPVVGIVYEFGLDECFYAWKGGGAWLRRQALKGPADENRVDEAIQVSQASTVEASLLATGFPYTDFSHLDSFMDSVKYFMEHSRGLRRLGSAATDIAYVACGRMDGFYEYGLHPWDIAAGMLLVQEAGGHSSDFRGRENPLFSEDIICSNGTIHAEFLECTQNIMLKE